MAFTRSALKKLLTRGRFRSANDGATIIEFALLAPIFFLVLTAIFETAMYLLASQLLESAVQDGSRFIRTGQAQAAGWDIKKFRAAMCDQLYGQFGDCSQLHIEVTKLDKFETADPTPPIDWTCEDKKEEECEEWTRKEKWEPGQGTSIVLVQVTYKYPTILPHGFINYANLPGNKRLISAATVFRSEPY